MWREFVSPEPDPREVGRIARRFRESNYEIKAGLRELLLSPAFWAKENRAVLVKSPVDLVVGTLRQLEFQTGDPLPFTFTLRQLGQDLFAPPNVKGWPGGEGWINSTTLLARKQFLERLFRGQEFMERMRPADGVQARYEDAPMAMRRVARLREEFGKGGNRMGEEGRMRMMRALESIRFDSGAYDKLLILVELKGGNDGLNTVVPYADTEYYRLRPRIAIRRDEVLQLDDRAGLHTKVESDIAQAAYRLGQAQYAFRTEFPRNEFGNSIRTASQVVDSGAGMAALRLTLNGFDTHQNQPGAQANLLGQLAEGLAALKSALIELNRWDRALILTYAEFGRRPKENQSNGTDHGTANVHFALGGQVKGGLYGAPPQLARLDGSGNLPFAVDFRSLYATVLERWWSVPAAPVLGGRFHMMSFIKT